MVRITPRTTTTKPKSQNFGVGFLVVATLKYEGMLLKIKWSFSELSTVPADSRYSVCYVQISTLTAENNNLLLKLQQMNMHHSVDIGHNGRGNSEEFSLPKHDLTDVTCARESKEEVTELSATGSMVGASYLFIFFLTVGRFLLSRFKAALFLSGYINFS